MISYTLYYNYTIDHKNPNQLTTFAQHLYCPPRPGSQDPDEAWPLSHEHSLYVTAKLYL